MFVGTTGWGTARPWDSNHKKEDNMRTIEEIKRDLDDMNSLMETSLDRLNFNKLNKLTRELIAAQAAEIARLREIIKTMDE